MPQRTGWGALTAAIDSGVTTDKNLQIVVTGPLIKTVNHILLSVTQDTYPSGINPTPFASNAKALWVLVDGTVSLTTDISAFSLNSVATLVQGTILAAGFVSLSQALVMPFFPGPGAPKSSAGSNLTLAVGQLVDPGTGSTAAVTVSATMLGYENTPDGAIPTTWNLR